MAGKAKGVDWQWLSKYYPISASDLEKQEGVTMTQLVRHCIQKWKGLHPDILDYYGLARTRQTQIQRNLLPRTKVLNVNGDSCALCVRFLHKEGNCDGCPLSIVRGGVSCDDQTQEEKARGQESPYHRFIYGGGKTFAMLKWLRKALTWARQQEPKKKKK